MEDESDNGHPSSSDEDSDIEGDIALRDVDQDQPAAAPPRTANEQTEPLALDPLPTDVSSEDAAVLAAKVISVRGDILVALAVPPSPSGRIEVLDQGSVLCTQKRTLVGRVEDVLGPVAAPYYSIRLMQTLPETVSAQSEVGNLATSKSTVAPSVDTSEEHATEPMAVGTLLSVIPRYSTVVRPESLNVRGSDASNIHNEEPAKGEMDFSDDEEERAARRHQHKDQQVKMGDRREGMPRRRRAVRNRRNGGGHARRGVGRDQRYSNQRWRGRGEFANGGVSNIMFGGEVGAAALHPPYASSTGYPLSSPFGASPTPLMGMMASPFSFTQQQPGALGWQQQNQQTFPIFPQYTTSSTLQSHPSINNQHTQPHLSFHVQPAPIGFPKPASGTTVQHEAPRQSFGQHEPANHLPSAPQHKTTVAVDTQAKPQADDFFGFFGS